MTPFEGHLAGASQPIHTTQGSCRAFDLRPTPVATTARRVGFTPGYVVSDTPCRLALRAHLEEMGERRAVTRLPVLVARERETPGQVATVWIPPHTSPSCRAASLSPARTGDGEATPEVSSTARRSSSHTMVREGAIASPACRRVSVCVFAPFSSPRGCASAAVIEHLCFPSSVAP